MDDRDRHGWEWIGDGTGILLVDRDHWEQVGRRAGVHDPYRAKAAFVCGAVREFLTAAHLCSDARAYLGASLLLMPPLEVFGRCVTGDQADGRRGRIREGVDLLNQLQRGTVGRPLDAQPIRRLRNFLAGGIVALGAEDPASLDRRTINQLGRGLALALDQYWSDYERRAAFAATKLTALEGAGNPVYIADMAGHFASGHRPSHGLWWEPPA